MAGIPGLVSNINSEKQDYVALSPISLQTPPYNEDWLQSLIHENPSLVPAGDVEAAFDDLLPVVREFPLPSGYLDNLYVTPDGYPVLVEVKLWKNQEARRKVVAQILEYAKDFAGLTYGAINDQIRKLRAKEAWGDNPLFEIVARAVPEDIEESQFVDRVSRNLREGRFLLLILGDGVREEMADLANYLMHHSLRYAFGIIEVRLFSMPDGSVMALPWVLAKTQTIERHVTVITSSDPSIRVAENTPSYQQIISEKTEKTSLSLDSFFENIKKNDEKLAAWIKEFLGLISDLPVSVQIGKNADTLMLKSPNGLTLMYINPPTANFWGLAERFRKTPDYMPVCERILQQIAAIVSAEVKIFPAGGMDLRLNEKGVPLQAFFGKEQELKAALEKAIQDLAVLEG